MLPPELAEKLMSFETSALLLCELFERRVAEDDSVLVESLPFPKVEEIFLAQVLVQG